MQTALVSDLSEIADTAKTLGEAIEITGECLAEHGTSLQDLSSYTVVMLWPVSDALRIARVQQFTDPRQGYKLDWNSWYRQLNADDQAQLPLRELNRARLYFDMRLVPIAVADRHPLCKNLDDQNATLGKSYLSRFENTHFYSIIAGKWNSENFAPLRERESKRADDAREWYSTITQQPTKLGRRIAQCLTELGLPSSHEQTVTSPHGKVRADIQTDRSPVSPPNVLVEIKAFSAENTMPSTIASAIQTTLRRHAQFAGFIPR